MYSDRFLYDYARGRMDALQREAEIEAQFDAIERANIQKDDRKHLPRVGVKILAVLQMFHFGGEIANADKSL